MRLLLDTCTFIWLAADPDKLSTRARKALSDVSSELFLSHASAWEIHMKSLAGKLVLPEKPRSWIAQQLSARQVTDWPIDLETIHRTSDLPVYHKDPFDRLLLAQSAVHDLRIVTPDPVFRRYKVKLLW
ncbi:MAG: type II toxin-antitoxin system VapC family toxin [Chthoniobacterales bacterium]